MAASNDDDDWDAARGVWRSDRARASDAAGEEVPSPLVIFGYGSLCWRPSPSLADAHSQVARLRGWRRLFAQVRAAVGASAGGWCGVF